MSSILDTPEDPGLDEAKTGRRHYQYQPGNTVILGAWVTPSRDFGLRDGEGTADFGHVFGDDNSSSRVGIGLSCGRFDDRRGLAMTETRTWVANTPSITKRRRRRKGCAGYGKNRYGSSKELHVGFEDKILPWLPMV